MKNIDIENRLDRIGDIYSKISELLDKIPLDISKDSKQKIQEVVLGNKDLQHLIDGINNRRTPRFVLIGRTGVGKSTLINAITSKYLAEISDVKSGTKNAIKFEYKEGDKTIFEIIDTRGIGESQTEEGEKSAEECMERTIKEFSPDAILFLVRAKERGYINEDVKKLKKFIQIVDSNIPIIALSTQVDELEPSYEKAPNDYSERKKNNISEAVSLLDDLLKKENINVLGTLPISTCMGWNYDLNKLKKEDLDNLYITFDGRYNIDKLIDLLENSIDFKAGVFLMLSSQIDQVSTKISDRFINIFSTISSGVALTPIPISDIIILSALQVMLIIIIAYLGGEDLDFESAKKVIVAIGGAGLAGQTLKIIFQQGSKFINLIYPGAGSALSSVIAGGGTYSIGNVAKAYFIQGASKEDLKDIFNSSNAKYKTQIE